MAEKTPDNRWHLDKKVQLPFIAAVIVQVVAFIWYGSKLDSRVSHIEIEAQRSTIRIERLEDAKGVVSDRVIRLEEQSRQTYEAVRRIEGKLDGIARRPETYQ